MSKTKQNHKEKRLAEIKLQLADFDFAIPGTIRSISLKCGKPSCACWADKKARHGPYHFWDRKVGGKLSSKSIAEPMVPLLKKWINNRKRIEKSLQEIIVLSQALVAEMAEKKK
jgi:hypothetical protein